MTKHISASPAAERWEVTAHATYNSIGISAVAVLEKQRWWSLFVSFLARAKVGSYIPCSMYDLVSEFITQTVSLSLSQSLRQSVSQSVSKFISQSVSSSAS